MFEGVWVSEEAPFDALGGQLVGAPVLAVGHFGRNVTGVAYLRKFASGEYTDSCSCAYIEQRDIDVVDLERQTVAFTTTCEDPDPAGDPPETLVWQLTLSGDLVDEQLLVGTVRRADQSSAHVDITLGRVSTSVEATQKQCPP